MVLKAADCYVDPEDPEMTDLCLPCAKQMLSCIELLAGSSRLQTCIELLVGSSRLQIAMWIPKGQIRSSPLSVPRRKKVTWSGPRNDRSDLHMRLFNVDLRRWVQIRSDSVCDMHLSVPRRKKVTSVQRRRSDLIIFPFPVFTPIPSSWYIVDSNRALLLLRSSMLLTAMWLQKRQIRSSNAM
jgi:hypothetical protein